MENLDLLIRLEARPYVLQIGYSTFGVFDTFEAEEAREAQLSGETAKALKDCTEEMLGIIPTIERVGILAFK